METTAPTELPTEDNLFSSVTKAIISQHAPLIITGERGSGRLKLAFSAAKAWAYVRNSTPPRKRRMGIYLVTSFARESQIAEIEKASYACSDVLSLVTLQARSPDEWAALAKISQKNSPDLYLLDDVDTHEQADAAISLIQNGHKVIMVTTGRVGEVKGDHMAETLVRMLSGSLPRVKVPIFDTGAKVQVPME